jgi:alanyl-tRNA synthetase
LAAARAARASGPAVEETVGGTSFVAQVVDGLDPKGLRGAVDDLKKLVGSGVAMLVAVNEGRASVAVGVTDDVLTAHSAVDLVKLAVVALGGQGGGGRADMAQGGGPDGAKAADAVAAVKAAMAG